MSVTLAGRGQIWGNLRRQQQAGDAESRYDSSSILAGDKRGLVTINEAFSNELLMLVLNVNLSLVGTKFLMKKVASTDHLCVGAVTGPFSEIIISPFQLKKIVLCHRLLQVGHLGRPVGRFMSILFHFGIVSINKQFT